MEHLTGYILEAATVLSVVWGHLDNIYATHKRNEFIRHLSNEDFLAAEREIKSYKIRGPISWMDNRHVKPKLKQILEEKRGY